MKIVRSLARALATRSIESMLLFAKLKKLMCRIYSGWFRMSNGIERARFFGGRCYVSAAHTEEDLQKTSEIIHDAMKHLDNLALEELWSK